MFIIGLAVMGGLDPVDRAGHHHRLDALAIACSCWSTRTPTSAVRSARAIEATDGNKWTLFAIYVVAGIGSMVVVVLTCGLGVFFVVPYMAVLATVIYLGVTGQRTMLDVAEEPYHERGFGPGGA